MWERGIIPREVDMYLLKLLIRRGGCLFESWKNKNGGMVTYAHVSKSTWTLRNSTLGGSVVPVQEGRQRRNKDGDRIMFWILHIFVETWWYSKTARWRETCHVRWHENLSSYPELEFKTWADPRVRLLISRWKHMGSISQTEFHESLGIHELLSVFCHKKQAVVEKWSSTVFKFGELSVKNSQDGQW